MDGDGDLDIENCNDSGSGNISVSFNQGNGTYSPATSIGMGTGVIRAEVGDLNGDGVLDLISVGSNIAYRLGTGSGSFGSVVSASRPAGFTTLDAVKVGDFNGDGRAEIAAVGSISAANPSSVAIYSVGSGTLNLTSQLQYQSTNFDSASLAIGDLNGDGNLDIVNVANDAIVRAYYGNGDGTFTSQRTVAFASSGSSVALGDFNRDGRLDVMTSGGIGLGVFLNNGNGTFAVAGVTFATTGTFLPNTLVLSDLNGDGLLDVSYAELTDGTTAGSYLYNAYGESDGSFSNIQRTLLRPTSSIRGFTLGDIDGDGEAELVVGSNGNNITIFEPNLVGVSTTQYMNFTSQENAQISLDATRDILTRVANTLGAIGAIQSRLATAAEHLTVQRENFVQAQSRIQDADVATESAELIRNQILQNIATSVLAQANTQPNIALTLLRQ